MKTKKSKLKSILLVFTILFTYSCCCNGEDGAIGPVGPLRSFTYDLSTVSGTFHDQSIPELSQVVLDNDAILGYLKFNGSTNLYPIPTTKTPLGIDIRTFISLGNYSMNFFIQNETTTFSVTAGQLEELRIVIIASTNINGKQVDILPKLKAEGVDINDYYAVMKHFGN
ncbi:hypothetical protein [Aquimarina megaterium]|uniref:hypothetical protein n=1 Tax=Aquimarina megaterium TaxID=1443666 RepID=UPI000472EB6B|nr:hypothetical protein [Aquimarina megaterium]